MGFQMGKILKNSKELEDKDLNLPDMEQDQDNGQEDSYDEDKSLEDQDVDDSDDSEEEFDEDQTDSISEENSDGIQDDEEMISDDDNVIFIAGDGDSIGSHVGQAILSDDIEGLHHISHAINQGQNMALEWTEQFGGEMISSGGDEFLMACPPDCLEHLEDLRAQYEQTVGATLSIGVGNKPSEAGKALLVAKLHGKDQVAYYDDSMEDFLDQVHQHVADGTGTEDEQKLDDHYISHFEDNHDDEHDAEAMQEQLDPNMDKADEDQMAEDIPMDDALQDGVPDQTVDQEQAPQTLKDKLAQCLDAIKESKDEIEQMKQSTPEIYDGYIKMLASMIDVAKMMNQVQVPQEEAQPQEAEAQQDMQQPPQDEAQQEVPPVGNSQP